MSGNRGARAVLPCCRQRMHTMLCWRAAFGRRPLGLFLLTRASQWRRLPQAAAGASHHTGAAVSCAPTSGLCCQRTHHQASISKAKLCHDKRPPLVPDNARRVLAGQQPVLGCAGRLASVSVWKRAKLWSCLSGLAKSIFRRSAHGSALVGV